MNEQEGNLASDYSNVILNPPASYFNDKDCGLSPKFLREFNGKREQELPLRLFLNQLGKDAGL